MEGIIRVRHWMLYLTVVLLCVFVLPTVFASSQGFTVESVSLSNILHPGEPESQVEWLVQLSLNGGGQSLVGTLDDQDVNYQGFTSAYPLQITGSTEPEQAFYVINNNQPQPIYHYETTVRKGALTASCLVGICKYTATPAPSCPSDTAAEWLMKIPSDGLWGVEGNTVLGRLCFSAEQIGIKAAVPPTPNIQFSSRLNLKANDERESLDLSYSKQSATSDSGRVQANWVGSLVTGNAPPSGSDYVAIGTPDGEDWIVKTVDDYDAYKTAVNGFNLKQEVHLANAAPSQCGSTVIFPGGSLVGGQNLQPYIDNYLACLETLAENEYSVPNRLADDLIRNGEMIGGKSVDFVNKNGQPAFMIDISDYFVTNPVLVLRIRGDFAGVVIPLGKPEIVSADAECFNSGNAGTLKISVRNAGNAEGSFYSDLSGCTIISTPSSPKYSVGVGKTEELRVPIYTTGANANIQKSCTVKVTDYNGGGTDSAQVSICIKEANQCDPNKPVLQGNSICPCEEIAGSYRPATGDKCRFCEYGVVADEFGKYQCGVPPPAPNGSNVIETHPELNEAVLQFGVDATEKVLIPVAIGGLKGQVRLGSHAEQVAKSSTRAFPNVATAIVKVGVSAAANAGCASAGAYVAGQTGGLGTAVTPVIYGACTGFVHKILNG